MKKNSTFIFLIIFLVFLTRVPFVSKILYCWDSVQFALAVEKFDVRLYQPHPPGYILFVFLGKIFNIFLKDANLSFILINIIFSIFSVIVLFYLGTAVKDRKLGICASLLLLLSPVFWFEGEVALPYIMECFFSILVAYLAYLTTSGRNYILLTSFILALAGGVRQNLILFLFPLFLYSIFCFRKNLFSNILKSGIVFIIVFFSWFLPMAYLSGGISEYRRILSGQWDYVLNFSLFRGGYSAVLGNTIRVINYTLFAGLGFTAVLPVFYFIKILAFKDKIIFNKKLFFFFFFWIIPSFLFYCLIFIDPPAYTLTYLPALFILVSLCLIEITYTLSKNNFNFNKIFLTTLSIFLILEAGIFYLYFPKVIKKTYLDFKTRVEILKENFPPQNTILVTSLKRGSKVVNYFRHIMYYLSEYKTYFLPEIETKEKHKKSLYAYRRKQEELIFKEKNGERILKIPENIKFLVVFDDHLIKWNKNKLGRIRQDNGKNLYYFAKDNKKELIYKYHYFYFR